MQMSNGTCPHQLEIRCGRINRRLQDIAAGDPISNLDGWLLLDIDTMALTGYQTAA